MLASDVIFPFRDNVDEAAKAGVTAVVQLGRLDSRRRLGVAACDEQIILAMVFTGVRHFRQPGDVILGPPSAAGSTGRIDDCRLPQVDGRPDVDRQANVPLPAGGL